MSDTSNKTARNFKTDQANCWQSNGTTETLPHGEGVCKLIYQLWKIL